MANLAGSTIDVVTDAVHRAIEARVKEAIDAEIEKAKGEIEKAKSKADAQKTLDRIKLRVSERVCDPAVFDRMSALVSTRFQEA